MSVNMKYGMDQTKVRKYGKLFGTIDFELNDQVSSEVIKVKQQDTLIGEFLIGEKRFPVTLAELDRIIETAETARSVFHKSYSMGRYDR